MENKFIVKNKKRDYFSTDKFGAEDVIRASGKQDFTQTVTTDYVGNAKVEIISRIYAGAPTIAANVFDFVERTPDGDKYQVKYPVLDVPTTIVNTSSPVYGQCTYTAGADMTLSYINIALTEYNIMQEICASKFINDFNGRLMKAGDLNDSIPSNINDKLINIYLDIASTNVEETLWSVIGTAIDASATSYGTAGSGACTALAQTGTLADFEDATKVIAQLSGKISQFIKLKKKRIRREDLIVFVPTAIYEVFQFTAPNRWLDSSNQVRASIPDQLGIYGIVTSHAIPDNKIYLASRSSVGLVTDLRSDWNNVGVLNLGDYDKKNKNLTQYSMFWRFGAGLVKPCETGAITLS